MRPQTILAVVLLLAVAEGSTFFPAIKQKMSSSEYASQHQQQHNSFCQASVPFGMDKKFFDCKPVEVSGKREHIWVPRCQYYQDFLLHYLHYQVPASILLGLTETDTATAEAAAHYFEKKSLSVALTDYAFADALKVACPPDTFKKATETEVSIHRSTIKPISNTPKPITRKCHFRISEIVDMIAKEKATNQCAYSISANLVASSRETLLYELLSPAGPSGPYYDELFGGLCHVTYQLTRTYGRVENGMIISSVGGAPKPEVTVNNLGLYCRPPNGGETILGNEFLGEVLRTAAKFWARQAVAPKASTRKPNGPTGRTGPRLPDIHHGSP